MSLIDDARGEVLAGGTLQVPAAVELLSTPRAALGDLFAAAQAVRETFAPPGVHLCAIVNARSGNCTQDCAFCAQSAHNDAQVLTFPMVTSDEIVAAARKAASAGAHCLGIVTSGLMTSEGDLGVICGAVRRVRECVSILPDTSLGLLDASAAAKLKSAGLHGYHHNVETARSFYPRVCSTRSYDDNLATIRLAKRFGFKVCSGGIVGLGETPAQRIEMLATLRDERVDRVCLNFLMPVAGTRLEGAPPLAPLDLLKLVAVARLMLGAIDINICAGRQLHLRDLQSLIFFAGASAMMIGNYLTQSGRDVCDDLRMLDDLGLRRR